MVGFVFPPPIEPHVDQILQAYSNFLLHAKDKSKGEKFLFLLLNDNPLVRQQASNLLCNVIQFTENKVCD